MIRSGGRTKLSVLRAHYRQWRENSKRNGWAKTFRDWRRLRHNVRIAINCAKPMPWLRESAYRRRPVHRILVLLGLVILLTGCPWSRIVRADPVPAQCDAMCYVDDKTAEDSSCASKAKWEGSPADPAAIDALIYGTVPALRKETWSCGVRLKACQQCIDRLVKAGVVVKP